MSKVNKEKVSEEKGKIVFEDLKLIKIFCIIVVVIFLVLFGLSFVIHEFIPATLIALALELFSVSYYLYEKKSSRKIVYSIFAVGAIVLMASVVYTLMSVI